MENQQSNDTNNRPIDLYPITSSTISSHRSKWPVTDMTFHLPDIKPINPLTLEVPDSLLSNPYEYDGPRIQ
jgi:hypothetical protein